MLTKLLSYKNELYHLALRITQNSQEAEDVVQDVIVKLWQMRDRIGEVENLEAFALRMTRNLSLDRQKLKANHTESYDLLPQSTTDSIAGMAMSPEEEMMRNERIASIRSLMKQMPEKLSTAMQLRDFDGHSYKEIADIMQINEDQVKVCIFRARQFVKSKIVR